MVINKVKNFLSRNEEKYEILYYKYSQLRLENKKLKEKQKEDLSNLKEETKGNTAKEIIKLYQSIENAKNASFQVKATDKDIQRLLIEINKTQKLAKTLLSKFSVESYSATERMYDPEIHSIASYHQANGMKKGIVMKTAKRGFKFKNKIIIKPRVVVTK